MLIYNNEFKQRKMKIEPGIKLNYDITIGIPALCITLSVSFVHDIEFHRGRLSSSTAVKPLRRFSFYLVGFKWKHGQGCIK